MATVNNDRQLRFRWNDHMQHVSKVLTLQRLEEQFCDVTLVSDDGFVMKAHQAILASTSSYFQRVLSEVASDQYPMIVLRGAKFREISCLLDYMYQGNTQVDQNLMESVLEVADMLEVKGLSRIRSNTSLKKFMGNTSTTSPTSAASAACNEEARSNCKSPEDEVCHSQQENRTSELDGAWKRVQGSGAGDSPITRETVETPTELIPMPHASTHTTCLQTTPQEEQDESQTSGIDLSLAKNEPWSPREGITHSGQKEDADDDGSCPAKKRRKHLENLCSEVTLDPVSDPDWGRIATKLDDRPIHKPRTISLTSITTSELGIKSERAGSNYESEEDEEYIRVVASQPSANLTVDFPQMSHGICRVKQQELCVSRSCSPKYGQPEDQEASENSEAKSSSWWDGSRPVTPTITTKRTWREMASDSIDAHEVLNPESGSGKYGSQKIVTEEEDPLRVEDAPDHYQSTDQNRQSTSAFYIYKGHSMDSVIDCVNQRRNERKETCKNSADLHSGGAPSVSPVSHVSDHVYLKVKEKEGNARPNVVTLTRPSVDAIKKEELLCPLEERLRRPVNNVKRPMNKYMLFQNSMRPKLSMMYPGETSQNITQRLGKMWKDLPETEKAKWECKAERLKEEHKRLHPDYSYNPKVAAQIKKEYSRARMERRNLYRINTYPNVEEGSFRS